MWDVFKYMQVNYSDKAVIRDIEKTKNHFEAFMGDKLKANLRVKFDDASVIDLKAAIEGVLLEEWPLIRRKATFLSQEQRDETYEMYLQDLKNLAELARFQETIKWVCKANCKKNVSCAHHVVKECRPSWMS